MMMMVTGRHLVEQRLGLQVFIPESRGGAIFIFVTPSHGVMYCG